MHYNTVCNFQCTTYNVNYIKYDFVFKVQCTLFIRIEDFSGCLNILSGLREIEASEITEIICLDADIKIFANITNRDETQGGSLLLSIPPPLRPSSPSLLSIPPLHPSSPSLLSAPPLRPSASLSLRLSVPPHLRFSFSPSLFLSVPSPIYPTSPSSPLLSVPSPLRPSSSPSLLLSISHHPFFLLHFPAHNCLHQLLPNEDNSAPFIFKCGSPTMVSMFGVLTIYNA